jgi:hypothetical protein
MRVLARTSASSPKNPTNADESCQWVTAGHLKLTDIVVGRRGLDPRTLGLKGTFRWLRGVGLVENSMCFVGNGVVSCRFGFVVLQKYEGASSSSGAMRTKEST